MINNLMLWWYERRATKALARARGLEFKLVRACERHERCCALLREAHMRPLKRRGAGGDI